MSQPDSRPRIVFQFEDKPDQHIELGECLTVGRSPDNSLVLPGSKVSRKHAEVRLVAPGRYRISDLGSANGTWLNGRRLAVPRELQNGDVIQIGTTNLRFEAAPAPAAAEVAGTSGTATQMANECVVVLVCDIRNYTSMTEVLPAEKFSRFVREWVRETARISESHGGIIDKFIGDAVLCFWRVAGIENPAAEVNKALSTAHDLVSTSEQFSQKLSALFAGREFRIGIGISMGNAMMGNVGTAENQSITIVGDSVNIAFRLEALTKQKQVRAIVSGNLVQWAGKEFTFHDLGEAEVKGRSKPVSIFELISVASRQSSVVSTE